MRGGQLAAAERDKVRREIANCNKQFAAVTEQIVQVNEAICEARPAWAAPSGEGGPPAGGKRGLRDALAAEASAEIGRLAAEAARSLGYDAGPEAAETVIRAGTLTRGGMLEKLLGADPGYRGPRVPCGHGHQAEFASYRDKVIDTVLGPVASPAPGTTAGKAAAAGPFAKAAGLLAAWPGHS
jgi:hypothetical protein